MLSTIKPGIIVQKFLYHNSSNIIFKHFTNPSCYLVHKLRQVSMKNENHFAVLFLAFGPNLAKKYGKTLRL